MAGTGGTGFDGAMRTPLRSRTTALVAASTILVAGGYGASAAVQAASTPSEVSVCVTKKNVVVSATKKGKCPAGLSKVTVGVEGPRGPAGPAGPAGATGAVGPVGPAGTTAFGDGTQTASVGEGTQCTIAEVILTAGTVANGLPAKGQVLQAEDYVPLFSLIGYTYGGSGNTFALPDLSDAAPDGMTYSICFEGVFPSTD